MYAVAESLGQPYLDGGVEIRQGLRQSSAETSSHVRSKLVVVSLELHGTPEQGDRYAGLYVYVDHESMN